MGQSIKLQENTYWDVSSIRVVKNVMVNNPDANTFYYNGCYYFDSEHTPLNVPTGNVNGWLVVLSEQPLNEGRGSGYIKQIWLRGGTAGTNDFQTYIRTGNLGVMNWGPWQRIIVDRDFFYNHLDHYTNSSNLYLGGHITGGNVSICTNINVPKRLDKVVSIEVKSYDLTVRTTAGGYVLNRAISGLTVSAVKADDSNVQITITSPSALSATNNTPVSVAIYGIDLLFRT